MKKFVLMMAMLLIVGIATGKAKSVVSIDGIEYEIADGTAKVVSVPEDITDLVVPDQIELEEGSVYEVTIVGNSVCNDSPTLQTVKIGSNIELIEWGAFYNCSNLSLVEFDDSEEDSIVLESGVFYNCISLENISLKNVQEVDIFCFEGCMNLKNITDTENVKRFGYYAFAGCRSLKEITLNPDYCVEERLCYGCSSLEEVNLSDDIKFIGNAAFGYCKSLKSIVLPSGLAGLGNEAFEGCSSLIEITLPETMIEIGFNCFVYCNDLVSITSLNPLPPDFVDFPDVDSYGCPSRNWDEYLDKQRIISDDSDCVLYVPEGCVEAYANAPGWKWFKTIKEIPTQGIESAAVETESEPIYYDLQGVKIVNPRQGSVVIRRQGSKSEKIIF